MNIIAFLSFTILIITILTLVFGVIAYFLYKARENKKAVNQSSYEDMLKELDSDYIFLTDSVQLTSKDDEN